MTELILECKLTIEQENFISNFANIKYKLPLMDYYIIEIDYLYIKHLLNIEGVKFIHTNKLVHHHMNDAIKDINGHKTNNPYYGENVTIAILDTGISPIEDFTKPYNRISFFKDFVNGNTFPYDDNGHGTHVAGIASGNGYLSDGKYVGVAPHSNIISLKILDFEGRCGTSEVLAGVHWVIRNKDKYNIRIMNLSVGTTDIGTNDPLVRAVEKAWELGIVVVIAAGNNGPKSGTVTSPGISRKVITVGSSDDTATVSICGETIENFSGRGPTLECIIKPDIIAPGKDIVSCLTKTLPEYRANDKNLKIIDKNYLEMSGTSMSTPMISGAIARLLSKYPYLTPNEVKLRLKKSSIDLNFPKNQQGWGLLDVENLLST